MAKKPKTAQLAQRATRAREAREVWDRTHGNADGADAELVLATAKLELFQRSRIARKPLLDAAAPDAEIPPLVAAVASGDMDAVTQLLADGADPNVGVEVATKPGTITLVPMDLALESGDPTLIGALLDAGVDATAHWVLVDWLYAYVTLYPAAAALQYQMDYGRRATPVGQRAYLDRLHPNDAAICEVLLAHGCDPTAVDSVEKSSAARKARKYGIADLIALFDDATAEADPPEADEAADADPS